MDNSVCLAYIRQKFVAKPFALARSFDKTCDIDYLYRRGYDALRVADFGEFVETLVRHGDDSYIRLDGISGPKLVVIDRDETGEWYTKLFAKEQSYKSMLKILGY